MYSFELIYLMYLMDMMMMMMIPPLKAIVRWCAYNTYNLKMNQLWQQFEDVVARSLLFFSVWDVAAWRLIATFREPNHPPANRYPPIISRKHLKLSECDTSSKCIVLKPHPRMAWHWFSNARNIIEPICIIIMLTKICKLFSLFS